jgi:hypothetical protein
MDSGISFAGDGQKDVSNISYNTQPSVSKSSGGPIEFVGNGAMDCSGIIGTNNSKESVPGSNAISFVAE